LRMALSVGSFRGNWCQFGLVTHHSYVGVISITWIRVAVWLVVTISAYYTKWDGDVAHACAF
jgi:hypothetical protein